MKIHYNYREEDYAVQARLDNPHCATDETGKIWLEYWDNNWKTYFKDGNGTGMYFASRVEKDKKDADNQRS